MVATNAINHISVSMNNNMFEASFDPDRQAGVGAAHFMALPLNLIAQVVSWIEDPGDLARMCRACRLLHYMALPHLYRNISLTSYDRIRYRDEQPEGWGNASPFSMGLNTLVTRAHASLVQSMTLRGEWNEPELEEHSRVGRVPDSSMMLNITVRAALDRTKNITAFRWELNTKMLETVYLGLHQLPKLTSLSIRFPSSRHPRPIYTIPAMPHVRRLKVCDIDPLCYPDDISTLLAKSPHLNDLTMHWSPRMRQNQEPSVTLHDYFRHCVIEKSPLKLKKLAFHNLYARKSHEWTDAIEECLIEQMTILTDVDCQDLSRNLTFVDQTWSGVRPKMTDQPKLKFLRFDLLTKDSCEFLTSFTGLEKLYMVNVTRSTRLKQNLLQPGDLLLQPTATLSHLLTNGPSPNSTIPAIAGASSAVASSSPRSPTANPVHQLRDTYLNSIMSNHGATLRHLILPARWPLSSNVLARLVHCCPNLEQLAMAPEVSTIEAFDLLLPFLRKLRVMRLLVWPLPSGQSPVRQNQDPPPRTVSSVSELFELDDEIHVEKLSAATADRTRASKLQIIGMGWKAFELGEFYFVPVSANVPHPSSEDTPYTISTSPSSGEQESPHSSIPATEPSRAKQQQIFHSSNSIPPSTTSRTPPSLLGKRARDNDASPFVGSLNKPSLLTEADNVYDTLPSGETIIWRRRVRPVGWEVLKNFEVFALDSQDV